MSEHSFMYDHIGHCSFSLTAQFNESEGGHKGGYISFALVDHASTQMSNPHRDDGVIAIRFEGDDETRGLVNALDEFVSALREHFPEHCPTCGAIKDHVDRDAQLKLNSVLDSI